MGVVSLVGVVTAVTSASIGAVVSELELVIESSVPPLHEVIVILTKKMINMTIIFFTVSSNIFCGKNLIQENIFLLKK